MGLRKIDGGYLAPVQMQRPVDDVMNPGITSNSLVSKTKERILAHIHGLWQSDNVRKGLYHRLFVILGMVAMLGALVTMPTTTSVALAMAVPMTTSAAADKMPCHEPANPCPDCPQNVCPDMGACLVNFFQPLSPALAEAGLQGTAASSLVLPAPSQVLAASLVPPLLRPPSV